MSVRRGGGRGVNSFPYGKDLKKVHEWIGQEDCPSNSWHIQYLGGAASLDDCEFHFLMHGMDNLVTAHCVLKGGGLGLPIGPKGISIPRSMKDVSDTYSEETREDLDQIKDEDELREKISQPFLDRYANQSVWTRCYNLGEQKQYMTRTTRTPFSLADLRNAKTKVSVVATSVILVEWETLTFQFPRAEEDNLQPAEMGGGEAGFSMPGSTVGTYNCRWEIRDWYNNFYSRCPFRKDGERNRFTTNEFLHYLPPYTGYLFWSYKDYLKSYPDKSYPFWQGLFPQLNKSLEHFMDNDWAGETGGWAGDLPQSYIDEFGPR